MKKQPYAKNAFLFLTMLMSLGLIVLLSGSFDAMAQARNPFSVGIAEGGGNASGLAGWILAKQAEFERLLSGAVRSVKTDAAGFWALAGISFAYGVFHAAGPGHGKAIVASYMLANERALQRGLVISLLAALLQGVVAIAIVGVLALLLNATAQRMKDAASLVETASYAGIAVLGLYLIWKKGRGFLASLRTAPSQPAESTHHGHAHHDHHHDHEHHDHGHQNLAHKDHAHKAHEHDDHAHHDHGHKDHGHSEHVHDEHCVHFHAPDPRTLGEGFTWGSAIATVFAAGSRPCSGAILVLVFSLAQGIFWAGVGATLAMSLGTALTTGALAAMAVFAKSLALRLTGEAGGRGEIFARGFELAAACLVFGLGATLLFGSV
ncbi:MAG: nickel/cobalt transporter, partial [Alphaproteobacteria bacterium]|nr:nickel/cobalt transporter [Alphaproteobacteria bacterium]